MERQKMKNEKPVATNNGLNTSLENRLLMNNHKPKINKVQYDCNFCQRKLTRGGHRFDALVRVGAATGWLYQFVDALRRHRANYFSNLGGGINDIAT
jgi:hypothetical protein